jgi:PIN domain nuclease of toxin-antitoxin system
VVWALHDPSRLSRRVTDVRRSAANELSLSPVSTWEALLLNAKGKLRLPANLSEWLTAATAPPREAPLTHEIVLIAQQLPLPQCDPADRFLAALPKSWTLRWSRPTTICFAWEPSGP